MNVEWAERKLDSLTGYKIRATQYQFDMFSPLYCLLFLMNGSFLDQSLLFYLSNDKSSDDELVQICIDDDDDEEEEEKREFFFSHQQ